MKKILFEWTIENFSVCCELEKKLESSIFPEGANENLKWFLRMYPKGSAKAESKNYLGLFLMLVSCRESQAVKAKCKLSILNAKREEIIKMKLNMHQFICGQDWGYEQFIRRDSLLDNGLLSDDKLTIFCEISVMDNVTSSNDPVTIPFEISKCELDNVGLLLFENSEFSDITVLVDGREIKAHKAILAAQSRVFSAMFKSEMTEKRNNVKIEDMDFETVREMLQFIYTGKVEKLEKMPNLLYAAEKYELKNLKVICEKILGTRLTIENVAKILILADLCRADYLKAQVLDIIKTHLTDVLNTEGYKSLANSHPHLMLETLQALATQNIDHPGNE
ncbi:protein roadkill-like isoform X2 [Temnothorax curvispinosus]|nr:protein roadkill-like isoform X2 [Temnothorax curvispinosus]